MSLKLVEVLRLRSLASISQFQNNFCNRQFSKSLLSFAWSKRVLKLEKYLRLWRVGTIKAYCSFTTKSQKLLLIRSYGEAYRVTKEEGIYLEELKKGQVLAKVLVAPVTLEDIRIIEGTFPVKRDLPFVPGNEAVMEIVETSSDVTRLKVGDRVIPKLYAMGTWRTAIVAENDSFIKIPADIDVITASAIAVNPCTAYRMLTDFVKLKPGDVVIQNCPNSMVGQAVIQIAAARGIHTVNVVHERTNFEEVKSHLNSLGSTLVISSHEWRTSKHLREELPNPILALNGFGGEAGMKIFRELANGGTMVSYGRITPLTVGIGSLIFKDLRLRGFWMTAWNKLHLDDPERLSMLEFLFDLSRKGKFHCPTHDLIPFEYYRAALLRTAIPQRKTNKNNVQVLVFE